ncbi:hypothetical protein SAMN05421638_1168 [Kaistella treverensis]|uniref:Lipoprotein n=1 Tax=Kaistella treverensis TaxID=631455 RepID=A0A1I3LK06_9FLAO|nr:hypothetical protein [Kaistella treverensis]SFI84816.1 hypothetical protein SAMN05421638_1168 [Kaistella treverensis]
MKKYFLVALLGIFSFGALTSCTDRNDDVLVQDNDTYSVVLDINSTNFVKDANNQYTISRNFTSPLFNTDVVLIYRKAGTGTDGSPVWQLIPRTIYLSNGRELDYDFDFTKNDIQIYADGNYDVSTTPEYLNNQTFRVVLVPTSSGMKNASVNYNDYYSVIKFYNIDDSKVKTL